MAGVAVAKFFESQGHSVTRVTRKEFDIAKAPINDLASFIDKSDAVINCAGVIKPMIAKMSIEDVLRVNTVFPQNLAKLSKKAGVKCFHLTTDCVYSGAKGNYNEEDRFDADDVYGMSKNGGEPRECMTLRTSIIGQEIGQSRSLIAWALSQAGKAVNGFTNHKWNGITTLTFAKVVDKILNKGLYKEGLFHVHSPNAVTKAELLAIFNRVYNLNLSITSVEGPTFCDRSISSLYDLTSSLEIPDIETQVAQMRDFFKTNF